MLHVLTAPFRLVAAALEGSVSAVWLYPWRVVIALGGVLGLAIAFGLASTLDGLPVNSIQLGYRGVGMVQQYNDRLIAEQAWINRVVAPLPAVPPSGVASSVAYKNIVELGDVDSHEFLRLMGAFTAWIAPTTGCAFCHSTVNMADYRVYQKNVALHMIGMVRYINSHWQSHVGNVGVTCNTCHRGHAVPQNVWYLQAPASHTNGFAATGTGQNVVSQAAGLTALPTDPFSPFLLNAMQIRDQGTTALPNGNRQSTTQTDWTYALMINFAQSLGVGCNFCHNSRAFSVWDQGTPNRVTAWYGIEMVRDLNNHFMVPITGLFPRSQLGPAGDVAKIQCATCHQGAYKPLYGASELGSYPELGTKPAPDQIMPNAPVTASAGDGPNPIPVAAFIPAPAPPPNPAGTNP